MEEALGRALSFLGCLGGWQRRSKYYNYYSPHITSSSAYHYDIRGVMGKNRQLSLQVN
ncbi:hypothetical protein KSP40_PGU018308 [Platanthera guangdongensis]|uniref:Uncharacterized protein n=1 Tax=Platanthera guangdongensis TaxID=2320717 RepID=A0ABR2LMS1_9ASPA